MQSIQRSFFIKVVAFCLIITINYGCATMDAIHTGIVRRTNPELTELKTTIKWYAKHPRFRPVAGKDRIVYCRIRNSSGTEIDLDDSIKQKLKQRAYILTDDPDQANFILMFDLRYAGLKSEKGYSPALFGAIFGGTLGAVLGNNMQEFDKETGAIVGGALGAIIGNVAANRNKVKQVDLVMDIAIGERTKGKVETERKTQDHSGSQSSEKQHLEQIDAFLYHSNRLIASARKMNLDPKEAESALQQKIANAIAGALP